MKNIRPEIIPVLLESQVLTVWCWKNASACFFYQCYVNMSALKELELGKFQEMCSVYRKLVWRGRCWDQTSDAVMVVVVKDFLERGKW